MKRYIVILIALLSFGALSGQEFDKYFTDATLRVEVGVSGRGERSVVTIDSLAQWPGWYGRRYNLTKELYPETLQILVIDSESGDTLYVDSKSPNVLSDRPHAETDYIQILVPKPLCASRLVANVYGYGPDESRVCKSAVMELTAERLDAMQSREHEGAYKTLRSAADPKRCINLAIVADGFRAEEKEAFYRRSEMLDSALFGQKAFGDNASLFNVVAVMINSEESGLTIPSAEVHVKNALGSHSDSFGLDRLVTIENTTAMWDALEGVPASKVIVLVNSDKYGGSGAYNEYAIGTALIPNFEEVVIHEFGHSFAWLGDEYESGYDDIYSSDSEPMEPNITTLYDFSGKWQNLIDAGEASLVEGGGYQAKGVWRGCEKCLMRAIEDHDFCVVCTQALGKVIEYHVGAINKP